MINPMHTMQINECNNRSAESTMTRLVTQRLQNRNGPQDASHSAALSERLGKLLALAAPNGANTKNMDSKALQESLRALQVALEKRRSDKASALTVHKQSHKAQERPLQESRRQALIQTVGVQQAQKIVALIREIRVLRLRRRDLLGSSALKSHQPMVCGRGGCSANVYSLPKTLDGKLPKEVRDIFFNTAIVNALEQSSLSSFDNLPWDKLLAQGRKHVLAYRSWLATSSE